MKKRKSHLFIPDTQIHEGTPIDHIIALANYAVEKKPDVIVMIGDWWDLPSLMTYEKPGSKFFHNKSYAKDVQAGNDAMSIFISIIDKEVQRLRNNKKKLWNPRKVFCLGNHEHRILRAINTSPVLEGTIGIHDLLLDGWEVHDFLKVVQIDGVAYSHYFCNPDSLMGNPVGGTIENKLKLLGHSFSMGHQQRRQYGTRFTGLGNEHHGLVAGAFYQHDEDYLGPQKNRQYWRGVVMKNEVHEGSYDPCFVSLNFLLDRYL
jgi:hypothetical protein